MALKNESTVRIFGELCVRLAGMAAEELFLDRVGDDYGIFSQDSDLAHVVVLAAEASFRFFQFLVSQDRTSIATGTLEI